MGACAVIKDARLVSGEKDKNDKVVRNKKIENFNILWLNMCLEDQ